jgi:hypothetical protein
MICTKGAVSGIRRRLLCWVCYARVGSDGYYGWRWRLGMLLLWRRLLLLRRGLNRGRYGGCGRGFLLVSILSLQQGRTTGLPSLVDCSLVFAYIVPCAPRTRLLSIALDATFITQVACSSDAPLLAPLTLVVQQAISLAARRCRLFIRAVAHIMPVCRRIWRRCHLVGGFVRGHFVQGIEWKKTALWKNHSHHIFVSVSVFPPAPPRNDLV